MSDESTQREVLVLLASRALRCGPDSPAARLVRLLKPYLYGDWQPEIHLLEGTYRALLRCGLLQDYPHVRPVPPGSMGGLVTLSQRVVAGLEDGRRVGGVIYLLDPRDATSMFPDSQALKRECVVTRTPFLATAFAAESWFLPSWRLACADAGSGAAWFVDADTAASLFADEALAGKSIGLIAHDALKQETLEFALTYAGFLEGFSRRLATGTTGTLLNGQLPERLQRRWQEEAARAEVAKALGVSDPAADRAVEAAQQMRELVARHAQHHGREWVVPMASGPKGGDVEIADLVRRGQCRHVLFFEDPHVSREHEADIQLLERATRIPGREAMCLHDPETAGCWADRCTAARRAGLAGYQPLVSVFREYWGVDLVATDEDGDLQALYESGAWYLRALVAQRAAERAAGAPPLRVVTGWGGAVGGVIAAMGIIPESLQRLEKRLTGLSAPLLPEAQREVSHCRIDAGLGILGCHDPTLEANSNAQALGRVLGCAASGLSQFGFSASGGDEPCCPAVDVALIGCGAVTADEMSRPGMPVPPALAAALAGRSVGEVGGICVDADGLEVATAAHRRCGVPLNRLRRTANAGGSVLVVAPGEAQEVAALAALRGGLASVIAASRETARRIVDREARSTAV